MKKRLTFQCWHCQRTFEQTRELNDALRFLTQCPFCEKEVVVDLDPYRSSVTDIFKSVDLPKTSAGETLTLPAVIPTTAPQPKE